MEKNFNTIIEKQINISIDKMLEKYDYDTCMVSRYIQPRKKGEVSSQHCISGKVHYIVTSSELACAIYRGKREELYELAENTLKKVVSLQDTREGSETYGMWAYYLEESLDNMLNPDPNMADFNARLFVYILKKCQDCLSDEMVKILKKAVRRAAECSIRRNVSPDYTNISLMSLNTIINCAEICGDCELLEKGRERIRKAYEYNNISKCFSEFNSPCYTPLALEELGRMMDLFEDEECRALAEKLNYIGWEMVLRQYDIDMRLSAPPYVRTYYAIHSSLYDELIYLGTHGMYGKIGETYEGFSSTLNSGCVIPEELVEKYIVNKIKKPVFYEDFYYKKNNLRLPEEDNTIIRNIASPSLRYFTYIADCYAMGAFEKSDLWAQRGTGMIVWGDDEHRTAMRTYCISDKHSYSSGMVYTNQLNNVMLCHTGFATDHGDVHYILDTDKNGILTTERLLFAFKFEGDCKNLRVAKEKTKFKIVDKDITIYINICQALFDGEKMDIRYNEKEKQIEAICFDTEKTVNFNEVKKPTYMIYTVSVNREANVPKTEISDNIVKSVLEVDEKVLTLSSHVLPIEYDVAIDTVKTEKR